MQVSYLTGIIAQMTHSLTISGLIYPYIRVSRDTQDYLRQVHTIDLFLSRHAHLAEQTQPSLEETVSTRKTVDKRRLGALIEQARPGDCILVSDLPRLGRDFFETISILHDLLAAGIGVISIDDNYVLTDNIQSKIIASGLLLAAELYRDSVSRNTKAKLAALKAQGVTLGRPKGSTRVHPKIMENLAYIRTLQGAGVATSAIARLLGVDRTTLIRNLAKIDQAATS